MGIERRAELYRQIEKVRQRPLIVYVTSKRPGVSAQMSEDVLPFFVEQLDVLPADATALDFLIVSFGGDPMVAWRIMSLIRQRVASVAVLVPQSAYSAATLVALGADEIVMHPNGHLGPVDMQITTFSQGATQRFSTEDISSFIAFVRENLSITDQRHLRKLFEQTCREVGTLGIGFTARSSKLASALGERLLAMHVKEDEEGSKRKALIETLGREFHTHAYPVSRTEAIELGLSVKPDRDEPLERLMWSVWLDLEEELKERFPTSPEIALLNSNEASKLLQPVPQLELPPNAASPTYFSADINNFPAVCANNINPVDIEHLNALLESERLAFRGIARGKILACRMPDLTIQYNVLTSFKGWESVQVAKSSP